MTDLGAVAGAAGEPRIAQPRRAAASSRVDLGLSDVAYASVLTVLFCGFLLLQISRHAMWRDELNAWGIVLASPTLADLFRHLHYEGHPGLWHLLLWFVARFTSAPQAIQVVHAGIGCGIIAAVAFLSPFSRIEKLLLLLSYFLLFDYTVVSRNYGIGVLLAFLYAHVRAHQVDRSVLLAALLGLLANTNVFALFLSLALALEYAALRRGTLRRLVPAAALFASLVLVAIATLWPAPDISWRTTGAPLTRGVTLAHAVDALVNNLSALAPFTQQAFWAPPSMIDAESYGLQRLAVVLIAPLLVMALAAIFKGQRRLLIIPGVTLALSLAFNIVFYDGYSRHWGVQFIAFVTALWIARAMSPVPNRPALAILGGNALAGILFTLQHWAVPFSNSEATAHWLRQHAEPDAVLVGTPDFAVAAVAELLGRPAYLLDCRCTDTYLLFQKRRDDFTPADIPDRVWEAMRRSDGKPLYLVLGSQVDADQTRAIETTGLDMTLLAQFDGALAENFRIFAIRPTMRPALYPPSTVPETR